MPNWCSNNVKVYGHPDALQDFIEKVTAGYKFPPVKEEHKALAEKNHLGYIEDVDIQKKGVVSFLATIDIPDDYRATWYDFNTGTLGTKWEPEFDQELDELLWSLRESGYLELSFQSAWAPPEQAILMWSEQFPALHFIHSYEEFGNDYWGVKHSHMGENCCGQDASIAELVSEGLDDEEWFEKAVEAVCDAINAVVDEIVRDNDLDKLVMRVP